MWMWSCEQMNVSSIVMKELEVHSKARNVASKSIKCVCVCLTD